MTWIRGGGGRAPGGNYRGGEKWWDFESILKVEPTEFANGLGFGVRKMFKDESEVLGL